MLKKFSIMIEGRDVGGSYLTTYECLARGADEAVEALRKMAGREGWELRAVEELEFLGDEDGLQTSERVTGRAYFD